MAHPILKEFSRKKVLAYARALPEEEHVGAVLFPALTVNELTFEYWRQLNIIPVSASLQAYGAEAQIASREGGAKVSGEIPPIKRKIYLDERNMLALKREGAGDVEMVRNQLYNDIDAMVASVYTRIEAMRMQALATGRLVLDENGVILNVDYGVPAAQRGNAAATWANPATDIIGDIQAWTGVVEAASGVRPKRALTSDVVIAAMLNNQVIRNMIWGPVGDARPVTMQEINRLLATMDLPQVASYNKRYRVQDEDGTFTVRRFFPQDRFVLMPETKLGDTLMGPTAEALLDDEVAATEVAGIYANVTHENEPPMIWTKAAATSIPTFPAADLVYQARVIL